jgi:hypothetical protein
MVLIPRLKVTYPYLIPTYLFVLLLKLVGEMDTKRTVAETPHHHHLLFFLVSLNGTMVLVDVVDM